VVARLVNHYNACIIYIEDIFYFLRNRIGPVIYAYRNLLKKDRLYTSKRDENKREIQEYCRNSC
jgi:hypothetical protein